MSKTTWKLLLNRHENEDKRNIPLSQFKTGGIKKNIKLIIRLLMDTKKEIRSPRLMKYFFRENIIYV